MTFTLATCTAAGDARAQVAAGVPNDKAGFPQSCVKQSLGKECRTPRGMAASTPSVACCCKLLQDATTVLANALVCDRLVGLVVRRPPRERKVPGSNPACAGIFSGSSHTSDLKIGTPVATLPGAWRYRVSTGTGRHGVSIM